MTGGGINAGRVELRYICSWRAQYLRKRERRPTVWCSENCVEGCAGPTGAKSRRPNTGSCDQGELSGRQETSQLNVNKNELTGWTDEVGHARQRQQHVWKHRDMREHRNFHLSLSSPSSIHASFHPPIRLSIHPCIYPSVDSYMDPFIHPFVRPSIHR